MKNKSLKLETIAIHAGMHESSGKSVVPPIERSTIFEHDEKGHQDGELMYTRKNNPNREQLEHILMALEEGESAAAFASGVAAISATLQALHPGSHVLLPDDLYHGTRMIVQDFAQRWQLSYDFIDMSEPDIVEESILPETQMVWVETPSNPLLKISSVKEISDIAHKNEAMVAVDNTWPTPYNMKPLTLGADLVIHSTTKYLGGHSDILGGAVISAKEAGIFQRIRNIQIKQGGVPSPEDCWLLARSIRSFPYRMRAHNENAEKIAEFLNDHPKIEKVYFPGLNTHPGHMTAREEMNGFGGMISFLVKGGDKEAIGIVSRSEIIARATSLGGAESTWEHRKSSEGERSHSPENLIRLSVGIEHHEDLIEDLKQALNI